jgi:hypothetical protein
MKIWTSRLKINPCEQEATPLGTLVKDYLQTSRASFAPDKIEKGKLKNKLEEIIVILVNRLKETLKERNMRINLVRYRTKSTASG